MSGVLICFARDLEVYTPGSTVTGEIKLNLTKDVEASAVLFEAFGEAYTSFRKVGPLLYNDYKGKEKHTKDQVCYSGYIKYLDYKQTLWFSNSKNNYLKAGSHSLQFCFLLPEQCPASFEGSYGYIRYWCKAKVIAAFDQGLSVTTAFTVMPTYDLNSVPESSNCLRSEVSTKTGISIFQRGNISMKVSLPKAGFVPGEILELCVEIVNRSAESIVGMKLRLQQISTYYGNNESTNELGSMVEQRNACEIEKAVYIRSYETKTILVKSPVPSTAPSLGDCLFIDVRYKLEVEVISNGCFRRSLETSLPILLGTVPVYLGKATGSVNSFNKIGLSDEIQTHITEKENCVSNDLSPVYRESVYGKAVIGCDQIREYVPLYPVYNIF